MADTFDPLPHILRHLNLAYCLAVAHTEHARDRQDNATADLLELTTHDLDLVMRRLLESRVKVPVDGVPMRLV